MMHPYLRATEIIDHTHPAVHAQARRLAEGASSPVGVAEHCFTFVRDRIRHSHDADSATITCSASEVLGFRTGYCYAKAHLLAALWRANGIPAGFCYQRLSRDGNGAPFCLHGLNAVYLDAYGWYRVDARGNKPGVDAQFTPPVEQLAWPVTLPGEADLPEIWPDPLPIVIETLHAHGSPAELWEHLPDVPLIRTSWER